MTGLGMTTTVLRMGAADADAVRRVIDADPVANCAVASCFLPSLPGLVTGGELWSHGGPEASLLYSGMTTVPVAGSATDMWAFAHHLRSRPRVCSSIVGDAARVLELWAFLELHWGNAREVREEQPLLAMTSPPTLAPPRGLRRATRADADVYFDEAVRMYITEIGTDPRASDGGARFRRRIESLIDQGRAWTVIEDGKLLFKAELGHVSTKVAQIHGVWVPPEHRGGGIGAAGAAGVAASVLADGRIPSLYVNGYNVGARSAYRRAGFEQVGTFATVLID